MRMRIQDLMDEAQCYDQLREMRWPAGRRCPFCDGRRVIRRGFDDQHPARQRYQCNDCTRRFDDLTGTVFAGHRQPLKVWIIVLYFMGLNLSNTQIAKELGLDRGDVQEMTRQLRAGILKKNADGPGGDGGVR